MNGREQSYRKVLWGVTLWLSSLFVFLTTQIAKGQSVPAIPVVNSPANAPAPQPTLQDPGHLMHEILEGNGEGTGYVLSHGGVIPSTLHLYLDGNELRAGKDYLLDPATGSLFFSKTIPVGALIAATYRYLDNPAAPPTAPGLQFGLGSNTQLGLLLGLTASDGHGFNSLLRGLSLNSHFGQGGQSSYTGLAYFSNVQKSQNIVFDPEAFLNPSHQTPLLGRSQLILQNLDLHSGGLNFTANYQDVGAKFNGFNALKLGVQGNQTLLQQLNQLEAERGIKRLGFGLSWSDKTNTLPGLALQWSRIEDGSGTIEQRSAELHAGGLGVHYSSQQIGQSFKLFAGLREAQKADWMHETGLQKSQLGLNLAFGSGKKALTAGGLQFENLHVSAKTGSLDRDAFSLQTKGLDVGYIHSTVAKGFGRLNDLGAADKAALALDTYRLYDPTAPANMVNPADMGQVAANEGLDRSGFHLLLSPHPGAQFAFSQMDMRLAGALGAKSTPDPKADMFRQEIALQLGGFHFALLNRRTGADFGQLATLPDIDKRYLALDILRQFDPDADIAKIPPPMLAQVAAHEAGLARTLLNAGLQIGEANKADTFSFSALHISDTASASAVPTAGAAAHAAIPSLSRETFAFTSPRLQFGWSQQAVSANFTRLPLLSDVEKSQFGNANGLRSLLLQFGWQIDKTTRLAFNSFAVSPTADAAADILTQTRAKGIEPTTAAQMAYAGLQRQSLSLTSQGLSLNIHTDKVSKYFTRAADLPVPPADKNLLNAERGYRSTDIALHLDRIRGLTLDTFDSNATNSIDLLNHTTFHHNLLYLPRPGFNLTYNEDGDIALGKGIANGYRHRLVGLKMLLTKGLGVQLTNDLRINLADGKQNETVGQNAIHVDAAQLGKGGTLDYQVQQASSLDGKFTDVSALSVHTQPTQYLTLDYTRTDLQRSPDATNPVEKNHQQITEATEGYGLKYQATKGLAVTVASTTTTANDQNGKSAVSLGLQGEPFKDVTLAAQFDELHTKADQNTHDVANFSIRNTKPLNLGPVQNLTIQAGYSSLNDHRKLVNEAMTGHLEWTMWKNTFTLDYNGQALPTGRSTTTRLYSFITDPNPKRWLHASFYYRDWSLLDGKVVLTRKFTVDARLTPSTHLVYNYGSLPDDGHGQVVPETAADLTLENSFRKNLTLGLFYRLSRNTSTKLLTRALGLSLQQKLDPFLNLNFSFSKGVNGSAVGYDRSNQLNIALERKITADDFFSIGASWITHDGKDAAGHLLRDELRAELSLNFVF